MFGLNRRVCKMMDSLTTDDLLLLGVKQTSIANATAFDFNQGNIDAGILFAKACMSDLADIGIVPYPEAEVYRGAAVQVRTSHPLQACMFSQYAGQIVSGEGFFAMGSGPWRAVTAKEKLFEELGFREESQIGLAALETKTVSAEMVAKIHEISGILPPNLRVIFARTRCQTGAVQVVARSVETALHKLHELGFDLSKVCEGYGYAPLPPVSHSDLIAMGRTNDAIIYGGFVQIWVDTTDEEIKAVINKVPSSSSASYGRRFVDLFEAAERDFYKMDGSLFAPAMVAITNAKSGNTFRAGKFSGDILNESFSRSDEK